MKSLIVCYSYHHRNTQKVAEAMAEVLDSEPRAPQQINPDDLLSFDLVGFGSGIYSYQHDVSLFDLLDKLPQVPGKKAFIFSTTGTPIAFGEPALAKALEQHIPLRKKIQSKGYVILGEFICAGYNTNKFLKYFGGINKGRPNEEDLKHAEEFALKLRLEIERESRV